MKKLKIFAMLAIMLASLFVSTVNAQDFNEQIPVGIDKIWINNKPIDDIWVWDEDNQWFEIEQEVRGDIERGDDVEIEIKLVAYEDAENIEVEAALKGYEHSNQRKTAESTDVFDVKEDRTYYKTLTLELPEDLENGDTYALRIEVSDKDHRETVWNVILEISTPKHKLNIDDVIFSPSTTVQAGRSLMTSVRLENFGQKDEDNVKVTFAIPELGVSDSDYIEELEADDEKMTQELYVRIPTCAEAKEYEAEVTVEYDDGYETVEEEFTVTVVGSDACTAASADKTVITVGPETQNVVAGGNEAIYPIALTNSGSGSKTYTLELTAGDWAETRLSENVLVLDSEDTKVAYVYVKANSDATAGEQVMSLTVKSNGQTLKDVTIKANVVNDGANWDNVKKGLEIGLIVLVVLLVILGLIIGFSRLKGNKNESEEDDQTYY
ncbi:hypothetical protein ACFLZB_03795 [Nanoarchaeota archaeon]